MTDSNSPLQYQPTPVGNAKAYEEILRTSIIHIGEEYQSPPEIIWVVRQRAVRPLMYQP